MLTTAGIWVSLALAAQAVAQKVVTFDIQGTHPSEVVVKRAKRATINAPISNFIELYTINATIGTPPQFVSLQLDTGSTDLWVSSANSQYCRQRDDPCVTPFNASQSSSYQTSVPGKFQVSYGDGSGASGDFFTDMVTIGNGNITITNQTMGLAITADTSPGLMGIGLPALEGSCALAKSQTSTYCYPTIIDQMVSQGHINSRAFSLFLNDLNQSTGQILFGGVDTSRYSGDLVSMPMIPLNIAGDNPRLATAFYNVAWTNFTITTPTGVITSAWQASYAAPALLDSGTSYALFPQGMAQALYQEMGAIPIDRSGDYVAPCYLRTSNVTFDFYFGGSQGVVLRVPINEFIIDWDSSANRIWTDVGGNPYCTVGFQASPDGQLILGDTVLRSGYFVYDMDNRQIAIAQANFRGGRPNIKEITNATASNIPGVTRTASQITAFPAATAVSTYAPIQPNNTAAATGSGTSTITSASLAPLASFTTAKYTGQNGYSTPANNGVTSLGGSGTSATGGSSTSSGAANAVKIPLFDRQFIGVSGIVAVFGAAGAALMML